MTRLTTPAAPRYSHVYRAGLNLFVPAVRRLIEGGGTTISTNPGYREQWDKRPTWYGLVYGNGRPGKGNESIINAEAVTYWPMVFDANGKLGKPPCSPSTPRPSSRRRTEPRPSVAVAPRARSRSR